MAENLKGIISTNPNHAQNFAYASTAFVFGSLILAAIGIGGYFKIRGFKWVGNYKYYHLTAIYLVLFGLGLAAGSAAIFFTRQAALNKKVGV